MFIKAKNIVKKQKIKMRQVNLGKKHTPEALQKLKDANRHVARPDIIDGVEYSSLRDARFATGVDTVAYRCNSKSPRLAGYKWKEDAPANKWEKMKSGVFNIFWMKK